MRSKPSIMILILLIFILISITFTQVQAQEETLTVKVTTEDDKPLKDAYVKVVHDHTTEAADWTDSDGEISFEDLEVNKTYDIYVYYPEGHQVGSKSINFTGTLSVNITVNVMSKWTIHVYDKKERDPVPSAKVFLVHKENNSITYSGSTGDGGKVEFGPIPSDANYEITVEFRGENYSIGAVSIPPDGSTTITLRLYRVTLSVNDKKGSPVEGVKVELREELDESPIASATSSSEGEAVLKLIPNGNYYLTAWLKGIKVYESDGKEIIVLNDDVSKEITVNAVKLNITILDYDGEDKMSQYTLTGKLLKDGEVVGEATSEEGVLCFGHTPFESYTLKITLGDLTIYSGDYEVNLESAEGLLKTWFYDVLVKVNVSALVNASIASSLNGKLTTGQIEFPFKAEKGEASLKNLPRSEKYTATLFYGEREVMRIENLKVVKENQVLRLNLTGYEINATTLNLDGKPVSANLSIILPGVGTITFIQTDESGKGSSGKLLPLVYEIKAQVDGMSVGKKSVDLRSDESLTMTLSVKDIAFKILDKDGEEILRNIALKLVHGSFTRRGRSDENGTIPIINLPIAEYKLIASYYGFKVLEDWVDISPKDEVLELEAPGVLDAKLIFIDSEKKPLDQGIATISFGGIEVKKNVSESGEVALKNLPNTTLTLEASYKGVKLKLNPDEFDLTRDEMRVVIASSVHSFKARVIRGDGKDLRTGHALLYLNDELMKTYDLAEGNELSEKLPEGEVRVEVKYEGRDAGLSEIYLDKAVKDLLIYSTIYPFQLRIRNPEGEVIEGAELKMKDDLGVIAEVKSDEEGVARVLLPTGSYQVIIEIENRTYAFSLKFEKSRSLDFVYPVSHSKGFELIIAASAVNLAISGYAISRLPRKRPSRERRVRRARRIPRL